MATKRELIVDAALKYAVDGKLNLSELRQQNKSLYVRICAVFENIDDFKRAVEPTVCFYSRRKQKYVERSDKHLPAVDIASLRNELAFQKLFELRKEQTFEQIADHYSVSKQAVHQLHEVLSEFYDKRLSELLS
jgi:hypothetical protein